MNYKIGMLTFLVVVTALVTRPVFAQDSPATAAVKRLKITIGDRIVTAVVIDSETARDFLTLLPMTVRARDYVSREKYWHLPRPLALTTERQDEYERGDIGGSSGKGSSDTDLHSLSPSANWKDGRRFSVGARNDVNTWIDTLNITAGGN